MIERLWKGIATRRRKARSVVHRRMNLDPSVLRLEGRAFQSAPGPRAFALLGQVTVDGRANIYGAGKDVAPSPGGGGGGVLPPFVNLPAGLGANAKISFRAVGSISGWAEGCPFNGPDGGPGCGGATNVPAFGGISGVSHAKRSMFLVGVFLGPQQRKPAPATLNVSGAEGVKNFAPKLNQQFYIGDGLTSRGVAQQFTVPKGATGLYFGFAENFQFRFRNRLPGFYDDNGGELNVEINVPQSPGGGGSGHGT
jgi:hypothetical protein